MMSWKGPVDTAYSTDLQEVQVKREAALADIRERMVAGDFREARRLLNELGDRAPESRDLADDRESVQTLVDSATAPADLRELLRELDPAGVLAEHTRASWKGKPEPRDWLAGSDMAGWLAAGRVSLLTGPGGEGKSRLALQLASAVAGDGEASGEARRVLPSDRRGAQADDDQGPVVNQGGRVAVIGWEDETAEVHRRIGWLGVGGLATALHLGDRLSYLDAAGAGLGPLWGPDTDGIVTPNSWTCDWRAVKAWLTKLSRDRAVPLRLVVIDPLAAAFGCNENDRAQVRSFLSRLNAWAGRSGAAVLLVAHPAKGEEGSKAIYAGSTDWRNGVRALWTLKPEKVPGVEQAAGEIDHAPALTLEKASYGKGGIRVWLRLAAKCDERGDTTGLLWRECTAAAALRARLQAPARADRSAGAPPAQDDEPSHGVAGVRLR